MNQRITKLTSEIERARTKATELAAKLKDLERQKVELENAEYVSIIRELDMTPQELSAFLKRHTHGGGGTAVRKHTAPQSAGQEVASNEKE
jgi:hypothetical protein